MSTHKPADPTLDLDPHEDIIERTAPGEEPLWLWSQSCPLEDCPCRTVLMVAAASREQLDAHVAIVRDAWDEAEDAAGFNSTVPTDVIAFEVDIDSGLLSMPLAETDKLTPAVEHIASRVDGDLLDRLASQWHLGKQLEDISAVPIDPSDIKQFQSGQLLAWDEVYVGARMDVFIADDCTAEAIDTYCVRPKCECNDVHLQFYQLPDQGEVESSDVQTHADAGGVRHGELEHVFLGTVSIKLEDPVQIAYLPDRNQEDLLERLFRRYQERYPNWVARLAERADRMASFGERLHAHLEQKRPKPWVGSSRKRKSNRNPLH